jgi:hypothetical protein
MWPGQWLGEGRVVGSRCSRNVDGPSAPVLHKESDTTCYGVG